jgi:hypothetical protein
MNCGCGQLDTRHKQTDIVTNDVRRAAEGQGRSFEETVGNLDQSIHRMRSGGDAQSAERAGTRGTTPALR